MTKVGAKTRCHQVGYEPYLPPPCANGPPRRLGYRTYYLLVSKVHRGTSSCFVGDASHPQDQHSLVLAFVCPIKAVPCVLIDPKALFLTNWHFIVHPSSGYQLCIHIIHPPPIDFENTLHGPNQTYILTHICMYIHTHTRRR